MKIKLFGDYINFGSKLTTKRRLNILKACSVLENKNVSLLAPEKHGLETMYLNSNVSSQGVFSQEVSR